MLNNISFVLQKKESHTGGLPKHGDKLKKKHNIHKQFLDYFVALKRKQLLTISQQTPKPDFHIIHPNVLD